MSVSTRTEWTCPMHPEIVRDEPGACPICGMALEPRRVALDDRNPELDDMWRRFRAAVVLTAPFLVVMVSDMLPSRPLHQTLGARTAGWLQALLATPVVLWAGWPFFERAWRSIVNRHLNMFTLIGLGTGTAYLYSVVAILSLARSLRPSARMVASSRCTSSLRRSSSRSCSSVRCWSFAPEAGRARAIRASAVVAPSVRIVCRPAALKRTSPSRPCT